MSRRPYVQAPESSDQGSDDDQSEESSINRQSVSDANGAREQEEPPAEESRFRGAWHRFTSFLDRFFKIYDTNLYLRVLDRRLGYIFVTCLTIVLLYIVIYVFLIQQLEYKISKGASKTFITSAGPPFYYVNGTDPQLLDMNWIVQRGRTGSDSVVLPTRIRVTANQTSGVCPMNTLPCTAASQCDNSTYPNYDLQGTCSEFTSGYKGCDAITWCPYPDPQNSSVTSVYDVYGAEEYSVTFAARIVFDGYEKHDVYIDSTTKVNYPSTNFNTIAVTDLLQLAGTTYTSVRYIGAVIMVTLNFECTGTADINNNECSYTLDASLADEGTGYTKSNVKYYVNETSGEVNRTHMSYSGIRIVFNTVGYATKLSIESIILHFYNALALVYGISFLTDFVMLNLFREKKHYVEMKFSDFDINKHSNEGQQRPVRGVNRLDEEEEESEYGS